jgi:hypothetical protein
MTATQHHGQDGQATASKYHCPRSKTELINDIPSLNSMNSLNLEDTILGIDSLDSHFAVTGGG